MFIKKKVIFIISVLLITFFCCGDIDSIALENNCTIVIDPGHGGIDTGVKITEKINEKDITLNIALLLQKKLLKESNIKVILTRNSDEEITAKKRKRIVQEIKPDFFLSIHINKGFGKYASGFELYYPGFGKDIKGEKRGVENLNEKKVNNLNKSIRMAHLIQRNLDSIFLRKGRGLREADVAIYDGLSVPFLIVEIGFASNSDDREKLLSSKTQSQIAQALFESVKSFYR